MNNYSLISSQSWILNSRTLYVQMHCDDPQALVILYGYNLIHEYSYSNQSSFFSKFHLVNFVCAEWKAQLSLKQVNEGGETLFYQLFLVTRYDFPVDGWY